MAEDTEPTLNVAELAIALSTEGEGVEDTTGDFDLLIASLAATDLVGAVSTLDPITVFAPTDAAFIQLAQDTGFEGDDEAGAFSHLVDFLSYVSGGDPLAVLSNILTYHVVNGAALAFDDVAGAIGAEDDGSFTVQPVFAGATFDVFINDGGQVEFEDADPGIENPTLLAFDNFATNGVVHVIDRVLIPSDITGTPGVNIKVGSNKGDFLFGSFGNDFVSGKGGKDTILLGWGDDYGLGGSGKDFIFGGFGEDVLRGQDGRDFLSGGFGDDLIDGGAARDVLVGGWGSDTFVMSEGSGRDRVLDFNEDRDLIDVSALGVSSFEELSLRGRGHQTVVRAEGESLILSGVSKDDLTEDNFIFADVDMVA